MYLEPVLIVFSLLNVYIIYWLYLFIFIYTGCMHLLLTFILLFIGMISHFF